MAGAGQPFYMPLTWPVGHVASALSRAAAKEKAPDPPKPVATPDLDLIGHATSCFGATRSFLLALLCIYVLPADEYPAFGRGAVLEWAWIWPIVARTLLGTWLICGFWDWFLYFSPV